MKFTKTHIRILLIAAQILIWISLIALVHRNEQLAAGILEGVDELPLFSIIWLHIPFILLINVNWYLLSPRYLKKGSYVKYGLLVLTAIFICSIVFSFSISFNDSNKVALVINNPKATIPIPDILVNIYLFSIVYILSMPFYLSLSWFEQQSKIGKLEGENLRNELNILKVQINPHFFFNTLNNLYSLTINNSDKAPEMIIKLSELMRYVIYDATKPWVNLQEEIEYLENYFEIQRIRIGEKAEIFFEYKIDEPAQPVLPLLFINLLENAFKHGADTMLKDGKISCSLHVEEGRLLFELYNQYEETEQRKQGMGLNNLRRRLALSYPNNHVLTIRNENNEFNVSLLINRMNELSHS